MPVNIRGKEYRTVGERVPLFREEHPDFGVVTEILEANDALVVMKASIIDRDGFVLATGHAEEVRESSNINRTSAMENAETSSIGRALASYGIGGSEYASADELVGALKQQEAKDYIELMALVREHWDSINAYKDAIRSEAWELAFEVWSEIPKEDAIKLYRAPTKGGPLTTAEREAMKTNEWSAARIAITGSEV